MTFKTIRGRLVGSDIEKGTQTRSQMNNFCAFHAFLSMTEPKDHVEALREAYWINAKKEELDEFQREALKTPKFSSLRVNYK